MVSFDDGTAFDRDACDCACNTPAGQTLGDRSFASIESHGVSYDVERAADAILACDLPAEFAGQLGKARGYPALVPG
jgi:hypothetical protein